MAPAILFPKHTFLAVVGADDAFWLCRTADNVSKGKKNFAVQWLEEDETNGDEFTLTKGRNTVEAVSVVTQAGLKKVKGKHVLGIKERRRIEKCLGLMEAGRAPNFEDHENGFSDGGGDDEEEEEEVEESTASKKRKRAPPKDAPAAKAKKDPKGNKAAAAAIPKPKGN